MKSRQATRERLYLLGFLQLDIQDHQKRSGRNLHNLSGIPPFGHSKNI